MAKSYNQKLKILYVMQILLENTDLEHPISIDKIITELSRNGISAERKSLYDDIETLRTFGLDIEQKRGRNGGYYIASRTFELPEIKLLVDAVQSSKFITAKKSNELIKKLESEVSKHEAYALQRQVFVANRAKTMNESIYYNIDYIHTAINSNSKITFEYFEWNLDKQKVPRHNGIRYEVSPWALLWDDEKYYMTAFDSEAGIIKNYRVDKMQKIEVTNQKRDGNEKFEGFDTALYSRKIFLMYGGEEQSVTLECDNSLIGVIIDRFGSDVMIFKHEGTFAVNVNVQVSPTFLSWIIGFEGKIKITSPKNVSDKLHEIAKKSMG